MILERALRDELFLSLFIFDGNRERRKQSEIHVHGLEVARIARGDVRKQAAMCRRRGGERRQPVELTDSVDPRKTSHRGRIGVSFHTDQLAGKRGSAAL